MASQILELRPCVNEMVSQLPGFLIDRDYLLAVCSMKWYPSYRDSPKYSHVFKWNGIPVTGILSYKQPCVQWNCIPVTGILSYKQPCVQWNDIPVTGILLNTAVYSMKRQPSYRDHLTYGRVFNKMASQLSGFAHITIITAVCSMKRYISDENTQWWYSVYTHEDNYIHRTFVIVSV